MTGNEKKLAIVMAGALVLLGGYKGVKSMIIDPRNQLIEDIKKEENRSHELDLRLAAREKLQQRWIGQTSRTFAGTTEEDVQARLREEVSKLIQAHQLTAGQTISPQLTTTIQTKHRKGFQEVSLRVRVEGSLKKISELLKDLLKQPYAVKLGRLSLQPNLEETSRARRTERDNKAKPASPDGPTMTASFDVTTLRLPLLDDKTIKTVFYDAENLPEPLERLRAEEGQYATIVSVNPFKVYEPPAPLPPKKPDPPPVAENTEKPHKPTPPPNLRPNADKLVLVSTMSRGGELIAFVQDESKRDQAPKEFKLNEPIDDGDTGKLILVSNKGIVVRVKPATPNEAVKLFFYPLGKKFSEREELNANSHPDIYREVTAVTRS